MTVRLGHHCCDWRCCLESVPMRLFGETQVEEVAVAYCAAGVNPPQRDEMVFAVAVLDHHRQQERVLGFEPLEEY